MSELNRLALDPPRATEPPVGVARWRVSPEDFVVDEVLGLSLADNVKGRAILPNGESERVVRGTNEPVIRSQQVLLELTQRQPETPVATQPGAAKPRRKKGSKLRKGTG